MPFSLIWLPEVLENAGLKVARVDGWETRGRRDMGPILGIICHHTAGSRSGNMGSLKLLVNGRPAAPGVTALPGPLSQLGLGRDGTYYVIAAGRCNHAGEGNWKGITAGNTNMIGIEAENTGGSNDRPWPPIQIDAYQRGCAAIMSHVGRSAVFVCGHKEYALPPGRKTDPPFDMVEFRQNVANIMAGAMPSPHLIPPAEPAGQQRPTLRRGAEGPHVIQLQQLLKLDATGPGAGKFGPKTEAAVREFQRKHGSVPDGIVGPKTWIELDKNA